MNTILITGCSSGFGLETAKLFLHRGWNVIATMRAPNEDVLPVSERLHVLPLDVTDLGSIADALQVAGPIDVLINNAGIGLLGALEGISMDQAHEVFQTNVLGTIAMTQAVLPQMREKGSGVIVNVTSSVTQRPLPLLSVYTGSKAAVNAFTESLALELEQFGIRVRLVIPGQAPETSFGSNARARMGNTIPEPYAEFAEHVFAQMRQPGRDVTRASDVAEAVWQAVTDPSCPMRLPAGADAVKAASAS